VLQQKAILAGAVDLAFEFKANLRHLRHVADVARLDRKESAAKDVRKRAMAMHVQLKALMRQLKSHERRSRALGLPAAIASHVEMLKQKMAAVQRLIDSSTKRLKVISAQRESIKAPVPGESKADIAEKTKVAILRQRADTCVPGSALCAVEKEEYEHAERRLWIHQNMGRLKARANKMKMAARRAAKSAGAAQIEVRTLEANRDELQNKMKSSDAAYDDKDKMAAIKLKLQEATPRMWAALKTAAAKTTAANAAAEAVANSQEMERITSTAARPLQERLFKIYADGGSEHKEEAAELTHKIRELEKTGENIYRSAVEKKNAARLHKALGKMPQSVKALANKVNKLHAKAEQATDGAYRGLLMEAARTTQDQIQSLKMSAGHEQKIAVLKKRDAAAKEDVSRLSKRRGAIQAQTEQLQQELETKLRDVQKTLLMKLRKPTQAKWEALTLASDSMMGLKFMAELEKEREAKLVEADKLVKPLMAEIRVLHEKATDTLNVANRRGYLESAGLLWSKIKMTRDSLLKQASAEAMMLKRFKDELRSQKTKASLSTSELAFLKKKVKQLKASIAAETKQVGGDARKAGLVTKQLRTELWRDEGKILSLSDTAFYEAERVKFMESNRLEEFAGAHSKRQAQRKAEMAEIDASLDKVHRSVVRGLNKLWTMKTKEEVQAQGSAIEEVIRKAQALLAPWSMGVQVRKEEASKPAAPPPPPRVLPPSKSPIAWEQEIHEKRMKDMRHVNDQLEKELENAKWVAKRSGNGKIKEDAADKVEDEVDAQEAALASGQVAAYELDCRKYPLLCKVGKPPKKDAGPRLPPVPPPAPDPIEIAKKLVEDQGAIVMTVQAKLAKVQKASPVNMKKEALLKAELNEQTAIMQKAQKHLKKLEGNKEEIAARTEMKDAKIKMDALQQNLDVLQAEEVPVVPVIKKDRIPT